MSDGGFPADVSAERGLDVFVFDLEGFDAEQDIEVGVNLGGGALEILEETCDAGPAAAATLSWLRHSRIM